MVVAPTATLVAGFSVTAATPEASVKAVAAGVMVARVASVLNVTTTFGTTAPAASLNVAFTVAGASLEMVDTVAPAALVSASVMVGGLGGGGGAGVVPSMPGPGLHPARSASIPARNSKTDKPDSSCFMGFLRKKWEIRTQCPM